MENLIVIKIGGNTLSQLQPSFFSSFNAGGNKIKKSSYCMVAVQKSPNYRIS